MSSCAQTEAPLCCHPDTPCPAVAGVTATIGWESGIGLRAVYRLQGSLDRLIIPPRGAVRRIHDLWRRTCFELFIGAKNDSEYYEFNFSPSGEWAAYAFRDYREGGIIEAGDFKPEIAVQQRPHLLEVNALVPAERLPGIAPRIRLSVGLSAVIEDRRGALSYWALRHAPGKPDFHHADSFALELVVPG